MWKLSKNIGLLYLLRNIFSIFNKAVFRLFLGGLEMGISTVLAAGDLCSPIKNSPVIVLYVLSLKCA